MQVFLKLKLNKASQTSSLYSVEDRGQGTGHTAILVLKYFITIELLKCFSLPTPLPSEDKVLKT